MRKKFKSILLVLMAVALIAGCSSKGKTEEKSSEEKTNVKIAAMSVSEPIVKFIAEGVKDKGIEIETVLYDGNHLPVTALKDGSLDGVILNHKPWLETFNKENNSNLIMPEPYMYYSRYAIYSSKYDKLEEIPENATIAVPGDPNNLDRSLKTLQSAGLIELKEKKDGFYNMIDIKENPKNLKILETEITATITSYEDVDAMIVGAAYVKNAGFDHKKFLYEDPKNTDFPLGLIVDEKDKDAKWVKAVLEYQQSDEFKQKFEDKYDFTYILFE